MGAEANGSRSPYSAEYSYGSEATARNYEADRFSGILGRYRHFREKKAVLRLVSELEPSSTILDCPCGTGRWWPSLADTASLIVGVDISPAMLAAAVDRSRTAAKPTILFRGDAEKLCLADNAVDYVFSYALTRHLPVPIQYAVLGEFGRVARKGVVCTFGIVNHVSHQVWRRRKLKESYPVFLEELEQMAQAANLQLRRKVRCTTPVGLEHLILFEKQR